jgi:hypothetical protein
VISLATAERAHAGDRIGQPLTAWDTAVARTLLAVSHDIEVHVEVKGDVVHLYPQRFVTTAEEVTVLRQFLQFTDSPIKWHDPSVKVPDIIWTAS